MAQDLLLRALYPEPSANLFVVADDDQSIYTKVRAVPIPSGSENSDKNEDGMIVVQLPDSFPVSP